ncbi:hypothetical protein [Streptomyces sp. NPDC088196]|uniref:hypothetical protein n=1 Tax=Streptomyces sp. NPDC088196 TaxID=3154868 RepID=UPI00344C0745
MSDPYDTTLCVEELREALDLHGIKLPSLGMDLVTQAGDYTPRVGLITLGNCNVPTARELAAALRKAAER